MKGVKVKTEVKNNRMEEPLLDTDTALAPFLELLEASSASTLRAVILKVLSHPEIFCGYDQLKAIVSSKTDDSKLMETLDLFSFGVYLDYVKNPDQFLPLNESQLFKLRQLTVVTSTQESCKRGISVVGYEHLATVLGLEVENRRAVEEVIISCIYARILNGKLCQKSQQLQLTVPPCCSRDVRLNEIPELLSSLQSLCQRLYTADRELERDNQYINASLEQSNAYLKAIQDKAKRAKQQGQMSAGGSGTIRNSLAAGWSADSNTGSSRTDNSRQSKRSRGAIL